MKTSELVKNSIKQLPYGAVFTYKDIAKEPATQEAVIKSLNRMVAKGEINKLAKGKFYKPEKTVFGELKPSQAEIVRDLLLRGDRVIGYLSGYSIYNKFGLTTQVGNVITIAGNDVRPSLKRGMYRVSFMKQKNFITAQNIYLLQLLDVIKTINQIPDASIDKSCIRIIFLIKELDESSLKELVKLSYRYPPRTRALTGAMLDKLGYETFAQLIKDTLNPITVYKLGISDTVLPNASNWNIK